MKGLKVDRSILCTKATSCRLEFTRWIFVKALWLELRLLSHTLMFDIIHFRNFHLTCAVIKDWKTLAWLFNVCELVEFYLTFYLILYFYRLLLYTVKKRHKVLHWTWPCRLILLATLSVVMLFLEWRAQVHSLRHMYAASWIWPFPHIPAHLCFLFW